MARTKSEAVLRALAVFVVEAGSAAAVAAGKMIENCTQAWVGLAGLAAAALMARSVAGRAAKRMTDWHLWAAAVCP